MKRVLLYSLSVLMSSSITPANSAVFERDWKVFGDGLLTYDDVNKREWLDLTVSDVSHFPSSPEVPFPFAAQVENAIAEIRPGGLFEGFTLASSADVRDLALSAGIDIDSFGFSVNEIPIWQLLGLLAPTGGTSQENSGFSVGWLSDIIPRSSENPFCPCRGHSILLVNPRIPDPLTGSMGFAGLFFSGSEDRAAPHLHPGLMLYRIAVPEPSTMFVVTSFAVTVLPLIRRRRNR